ncbi:MAG: lipopolysaccharide biosynthesis protein, partial [Bacteroidota bacterium]|nr:lipopolysaccharide biosynthesis protein [Bacteroidota bacterium]
MSDHRKDSNRLAKNTGFMLLRLLIVATVGLYSSRVVLDVLGESDYGVYNVVGSVVILMSFLRIALMVATNRFISYDLGVGDMERLRKTFSMCVNVHVILAGILFVVLEAVGPWFIANHLNIDPDRMVAAQIVFQFSLVTMCLDIVRAPYNSAIIAHERLGFYTLTSLVDVFMKLALIFALKYILFDKLIVYGAMMLAVSVVMLLWYISFCLKKFPETHYLLFCDGRLVGRLASH